MATYFEWDVGKAARNLRKHEVSFETAKLAFADPFKIAMQDRVEEGEQRWQTLGMVKGLLLILVAHTVDDENENGQPIEIIRIISARTASRAERRRYEQEPR